MNKPRFEIVDTPLGFVVRTVHPDHPKHKWSARPWRKQESALMAIFLITGNAPVLAPAGSGWVRGVDWGRWGFVEVRDVNDEMPRQIREVGDVKPVRTPARLGRPPRQVYGASS